MSSKRPLLETIWDRTPRKLVVLVVEASGLAAISSKGYSDPYVKITLSRQLAKTQVKRKLLNPTWNEFFYFEPDGGRLVFEVYDNIKQKFMGQAIINNPSEIDAETVVEEILELKVRPGKKKDRAQGKIKVRLYYSTNLETRQPNMEHRFFYEEFTPHFQTGDLIAYSEYGLLATTQKLLTNSKFSRVAMVLRLANKWTQKEELYLLEVTRNIDNFLDAYRETATNGLSIFRFFERIHHIHASAVYWIPLKKALSEAAKAKMVEHIWNLHAQITHDNIGQSVTASYTSILEFLVSRFSIGTKFPHDVTEVYTPSVITQCLAQAGITADSRGAEVTCSDILKLSAFQEAILLRCGSDSVPSSSVSGRDSSQPAHYATISSMPTHMMSAPMISPGMVAPMGAPGMMPGPGMMGPGMMAAPGMMGPGMMAAPGMMGPDMSPLMMPGPGMMGPGMMAPGGEMPMMMMMMPSGPMGGPSGLPPGAPTPRPY